MIVPWFQETETFDALNVCLLCSYSIENNIKSLRLLPKFLFLEKTVVIPVLLSITKQIGEFSMVI